MHKKQAQQGSVLLIVVFMITFMSTLYLGVNRQGLVTQDAIHDALDFALKEMLLDSCMRHAITFCQDNADNLTKTTLHEPIQLEYKLDRFNDQVMSSSIRIQQDKKQWVIEAVLFIDLRPSAAGSCCLRSDGDHFGKAHFTVESYSIR